MKGSLGRFFAALFLLILFTSSVAALPVTVTEEIDGEEITVTFEEPPQRAISMSQFSTEMLLALGLKERMAGTAFLEEAIAEKVKSDYEDVPVLAEKWPSLEVFMKAEPDFAIGWGVAFSKKGLEAKSIASRGVKIFIPKSTIEFDATMDTLMEDFITLGKIFEIEETAGSYVAAERARLLSIEKKVGSLPAKTVFVYDSGDTEPFTVFEGFTTNLLKMAGAKNILSGRGVQKTWGKANWEDVIAQAPDYFMIVEYDTAIRDQTDGDSKISYIKSNPKLQGLKAVKNKAFIRVRLADICPGIRNVDFIEFLARAIHDGN
jgi:iron complex transport system substrate-binding protein